MRKERETYRWFWMLCLLCCLGSVKANQTLESLRLDNTDSVYSLVPYIYQKIDVSSPLTIDDIRQSAFSDFKRSEEALALNLGYSKYTHWFCFEVETTEEAHWLLEIDYAYLEDVQVYYQVGDSLINAGSQGRSRAYYKRHFAVPHYFFSMDGLPVNERVKVYFSVRSVWGMLIPINMMTSETAISKYSGQQKWMGIYYGILLAISVISISASFKFKEKSMLYYSLYVLMYFVCIYIQNGHFEQHIWPNVNWGHDHFRMYGFFLAMLTGIQFVKDFFSLRQNSRLFYVLAESYKYWILVLVILDILFPVNVSIIQLTIYSLMPIILLAIVIGVGFYRRGIVYSRFFIWGWAFLLMGIILRIGAVAGFLPASQFTLSGNMLGSICEIAFLAIAIGGKIRTIEDQQRQLKADLIRTLTENEKIKDEANKRLELEVKEKTKDLIEKNKMLETRENIVNDQKQMQYNLESLRSQMDPHFIFNSLESVREFILENDKISSSKYLIKFSRLMRQILDNSKEPFVKLDAELQALEAYLEVQQIRFNLRFDFVVEIDPDLRAKPFTVPSMLLQPFVEQIIRDRFKEISYQGKIHLRVVEKEAMLCFLLEDNGSNESEENLDVKTIEDRLALLEKFDTLEIRSTYINRQQGKKTEIHFPVLLDHLNQNEDFI